MLSDRHQREQNHQRDAQDYRFPIDTAHGVPCLQAANLQGDLPVIIISKVMHVILRKMYILYTIIPILILALVLRQGCEMGYNVADISCQLE